MRRTARAEHNREMIELWMITRGMKLSTRPPGHPDEFHGNVNKPGSRLNQDATWLEAISEPVPRNTNHYLERVLRDLEAWEPDAYDVLFAVYLGPRSDVSLPERWRKQIEDELVKRSKNERWSQATVDSRRWLLHYLEDAFVFLLYRAHHDRRLLYWPTPDGARGYVERNRKKHREARYHYLREREAGTGPTQAVRVAARRSKASEQAIWFWKAREKWDGPKVSVIKPPNGKQGAA